MALLYTSQKRIENGANFIPDEVAVTGSGNPGKTQNLCYCETCEDLILLKCSFKGGEHHDHDCSTLDDAREKYERVLEPSLKKIEAKLLSIDKAHDLLVKCHGEIFEQQQVIEASINDNFAQLHQVLDIRKNEMVEQLHQVTQERLQNLTTQKVQMETVQIKLNNSLDFIKKTMENGNQKVLKSKANLTQQVEELSTPFQSDFLKPVAEADIVFAASPDAILVCQNYGQLYTQHSPNLLECYAESKGLECAVIGEKSTAVLHVFNHCREPYMKPLKSQLQCELVSEITGATVRGTFERRELNQYEISYHPTLKGRHQLHIKVDSKHIRGSPFSTIVKLPVEKLKFPIRSINMRKPVGVAVSRRGEVIVTKHWDNFVSVFSSSGEGLRTFGSHGSSHGQFKDPCGVALDGDGNILVGDKHHIQRFTMNGELLTAVSTKGDDPDGSPLFKYPCGITFNASNNKVYVVDESHRVRILNSDLTLFKTFGRQGSGKGEFNTPWGIACDSAGNVYVADSKNSRIQVFTAEGEFLRMFGRCGQDIGELKWPVGIAIDANDFVYVSEGDNHRVSVFTSEGQFVTSIGGKGEKSGMLDRPMGLAVDNIGVIYICERANNRIQLF